MTLRVCSRSASWMLQACSHGDLFTVKTLMHMHGNKMLRAHSSDGCTPLQIASKRGDLQLVKFLLERGASIDDTDLDPKRRGNALHYASWGGNLQLVRFLLDEHHADPGCTDIVGNTPLLYAIYGGHRDVVDELVRRGRTLFERNNKGHTPILQAACGGHRHLVEWLLDQGHSLVETDSDGNTPLLFAAWGGHLELMQFLLSRGANLDEVNNNGHNVFLSAANGGQVEVVDWLLSRGFELSAQNSNGDTALLLAAYGGHIRLVKRLLELGASLLERNQCGFTALLSAANGVQLKMTDWLLRHGASISEKDNDGYTALILAACSGNVEFVDYLLQHGANIEERNSNGDTCLLLAAYCGHSKLVEALIARGANLHERNRTGMGILISAANGGHIETVKLVHKYVGTKGLEETDEGGYTPLLLAAQRGHYEVVRYLAAHGANLHARTSRYRSQATVLAMDFPEIVAYLEHVAAFNPLQVAIDARETDRVHELLLAGVDLGTSGDEQSAPLALAGRVASYPGALEVDVDLLHLLQEAQRPWHPSRHMLFGDTFKRGVMYMLWLKKELDQHPTLPYLPTEIWERVLSFLQRSWFLDSHSAHALAPLRPHDMQLRADWREQLLHPKVEVLEDNAVVYSAVSAADDEDMQLVTAHAHALMADVDANDSMMDLEDDDVDLRGSLSSCDSPVGEAAIEMAENDFDARDAFATADLALFGKAVEEDQVMPLDEPLHVRITWV